MWSELYSWITSLSDKLLNGGESEDYVDYYTDYFVNTSVCGDVFMSAVLISLGVALIYYFVICNKSFALAKRGVWIIVLILTCCVTFFVSNSIIRGYDSEAVESSTGAFFAAYQTETEKLDNTADDSERIAIQETAHDYREAFESGEETLSIEIALVNAIYAMFFFFVFSLCFKRFTTHGSAIPI